MNAYVTGVGLTPFGDLSPADAVILQCRAADLALADAGIERGAVDGLLLGYATTAPHLMPATRFAETFGLKPTYAHGVQAGGATGLAMVALAQPLIVAGAARTILVVAGENRRTGQTREDTLKTLAQVGDPHHEVLNGASVPAYYALVASQYLHRTGLGERNLAELAVLMRAHAVDTEGAQFRRPITVDDVMASKPIATPLKLLDCCPVSDGAAALVVSADPDRRRLAITGTGQAHTHQHLSSAPADIAVGASQAAEAALAMAGRSVGDLGRIAIYDSFTITLALLLEACGFCAPGTATRQAASGRFHRNGALPLNTHGGLLSYGHSGVSGGLAHLVETVRRLREDDERGEARRPVAFLHADGGVLSAHVSIVLEANR